MSTFLHALTWLQSLVPRVDDPMPERVNLSLPFTLAGAGTVVGDLARFRGSAARRDRAARFGSLCGFGLGLLIYGAALVVQLVSTR